MNQHSENLFQNRVSSNIAPWKLRWLQRDDGTI